MAERTTEQIRDEIEGLQRSILNREVREQIDSLSLIVQAAGECQIESAVARQRFDDSIKELTLKLAHKAEADQKLVGIMTKRLEDLGAEFSRIPEVKPDPVIPELVQAYAEIAKLQTELEQRPTQEYLNTLYDRAERAEEREGKAVRALKELIDVIGEEAPNIKASGIGSGPARADAIKRLAALLDTIAIGMGWKQPAAAETES